MTVEVNFRTFALSLYAAPEVEAECLRLQDEFELSVPLLLCCAWLDYSGKGAGLEALRLLPEAILAWEQQVVWPLRQLRRRLKSEAGAHHAVQVLRQKIKEAEIAAELEVLNRLSTLPWASSSVTALHSLAVLKGISECDSFGALRARMTQLKRDTLTGQTN